MPRRMDAVVNVRNNLSSPKVTNRKMNAARQMNDEPPPPDEDQNKFDRSGMVFTAIFAGIFLLIILFVCFLITHFETNRHLRQMTNNINNSRQDLMNLTKQLSTMMVTDDIRVGSPLRSRIQRIDHAQFSLGAKVIKLQAVELPMTGPSNEMVRNILGLTLPKTACNILGRSLDRKNFLVIKGDKAIITIRLHQPIYPDTIRIDHYIEDLRDFQLSKAMPKDIIAYGIHMKTSDPVPLGQMRLNINYHSKQQSGLLHVKPQDPYEVFKIEILSNHGNSEFTRLYKVRIYGNVVEE